MNIVRRGSAYNYGERTISFDGARFSVDAKGAVRIEATGVKDFTGESHHDYSVVLEPEDLIRMLNSLAASACANPSVAEQELSSALKSLVQLQYVVAGVAKLPNQALQPTGHKADPRLS